MYRTAIRTAARPAARCLRTSAAPKRFASTASSPADRPRSWKGSALRWGLAGAALYYYNTSPVFADEALSTTVPPPPTFAADELPTVDSLIEEKRTQAHKAKADKAAAAAASKPATDAKAPASSDTAPESGETTKASQAVAVEEGAGALEEEAGQQGAFNPETGEINWDCPCLGGMADGPCGEEFKTAFSCFVYSNEEPKGMDCIEKFQGMQDCFRQYPEIYGAELADEEEALQEGDAQPPVGDVEKASQDNVIPSQKVKEDPAVDNAAVSEKAAAAADIDPRTDATAAPEAAVEPELAQAKVEVEAKPEAKEAPKAAEKQ